MSPDAWGELQAGTLSSEQVTVQCLQAIAARNTQLCAFTFVDAQNALGAARRSDARRQNGTELGPLDGLPIALKANIAVRGWPLTAGLRYRRSDRASDDASLTQRLRAAGAVLLGQTNMDEGALGAEGLNPWYGSTDNPWRSGWSAGGSSSGSAVSVAAGLVPLALGTDTIGSLRIPASFCGIAALKPTYGLLSVRGIVPVHLRFDHAGPMALRVEELRAALIALAAFDPQNNVSIALELKSARAAGSRVTIAYGVGLDSFQITSDVVAAYNEGLAALRAAGHQLVPIDLSRWDLPRLRRAILTLCEVQMWRVHRQRLNEQADDFSDGLRAFIRYGGKLGADDIHAAELRISQFIADWTRAMAPFDVCVLPTTACASFPQRERHPQNTADLTAIASATGTPALSLPLPSDADALPAGLQLLGPMRSDLELLRIGAELQTTHQWYSSPPDTFKASPVM